MDHQESSILSERKEDLSASTNSTEPARIEAIRRIALVPKFHRSEFLVIKRTVGDVLCWFKNVVVLKHVRLELFFAVELVNHLLSLVQLDKKYGVDLHVLRYTIGKLREGLIMVKAKAMENVELAMQKERRIQIKAKRREERMEMVRENMERIARWAVDVAESTA